MHSALFLDRDGVIIENRADYVRTVDQVNFYTQALAALVRYRSVPHKIVMVTNQSGIGRGLIKAEIVDQINSAVVAEVESAGGRIDAVYTCPHDPADRCSCRKPEPGLLLQAAEELNIDLSRSLMIGDSLTDVGAGRNAGVMESALILTGRGQEQLRLPAANDLQPLSIFPDLAAALDTLVGQWPR